MVHYCGPKCQRDAWPGHKTACAEAAKAARGNAGASRVPAGGVAPPVWDGMVSVDVRLSRERSGDGVELSRGNRSATARAGRLTTANSRVSFDPFQFTRAEAVLTINAGDICFGVRESDSAAPSPRGVFSRDVLAVTNHGSCVIVRGLEDAPSEFDLFDAQPGETFTLRLDRAARAFYYIVRGAVSPVQFTDLASAPSEFVFFFAGFGDEEPVSSHFTIVDVRVDAASAAAAAPDSRAALPRTVGEVCRAGVAAAACGCVVRAVPLSDDHGRVIPDPPDARRVAPHGSEN